MTDGNPSPSSEGEMVELPPTGDAAFAVLMDTLVSAEEPPAAGESGEEAPPPGAGAGQSAPAGEGAGAAEGAAAAPGNGDGGQPGVAPAAGVDADAGNAGGDAPAAAEAATSTLDARTLEPKWAEVLTGLETKQFQEFQAVAVNEIKTEYKGYVDLLNAHPRTLVGQKVPSLQDPSKEEVLRDSTDAKEWQEAVQQALGQEVRDRISRQQDGTRQMMETLNNSVELFRQNPDIVPRTKQFDKELADRFAEVVEPYQLRVDGKLVGYTIPVQPLLAKERARLAAEREAKKTAAPPAPATPSPQQQRAAEQARTAQGQFTAPGSGPQAAIPSKAGSSSDDGEDFSTLFGTIGLPGLRI